MADKWIRPDLAHMLQCGALADWTTLARWAVSAADWAEDHNSYLSSQAVNETAS